MSRLVVISVLRRHSKRTIQTKSNRESKFI